MSVQRKKIEGMTIAQASRAWGVSITTVRKWLAQDRLRVVEYYNGLASGRSGKEPLLIMILDKERPEPVEPGTLSGR